MATSVGPACLLLDHLFSPPRSWSDLGRAWYRMQDWNWRSYSPKTFQILLVQHLDKSYRLGSSSLCARVNLRPTASYDEAPLLAVDEF